MIMFIVAMLAVGGFTAFFFGTDAAMQAGLKAMDYWILAGLAVAIVGPFIRLGWLILSWIKPITHLFHRRTS